MGIDERTRELATLVVRAGERLKSEFAEAVSDSGLSVPAARALLLMAEPAPMRSLAEALACDQSYITRIADELEQAGLIRRTPGEDRRIQMLALTSTGVRKRDQLAESVTAKSPLLQGLSDADRSELQRVLALILGV